MAKYKETMKEEQPQKYIFLDFDGVINTEQYQAELAITGKTGNDMYGPLFDPGAIKQLSHNSAIHPRNRSLYMFNENTRL